MRPFVCKHRSIRLKIESVAGHTTLVKVAVLQMEAPWMTGFGLSGKCVGYPERNCARQISRFT